MENIEHVIAEAIEKWSRGRVIIGRDMADLLSGQKPTGENVQTYCRDDLGKVDFVLVGTHLHRRLLMATGWRDRITILGARVLHCPDLEPDSIVVVSRMGQR